MFSTPLICSSIGVTTVAATTSALAPGYWPVTLMIGGAISGYCATGSRENDTPPRITKTIETTAAKIGRSMKKCEMRISGAFHPLWLRSAGFGFGAGAWPAAARSAARDLPPGRARIRPLTMTRSVGARPSLMTRKPAVELAERDVFLPHHAAVIDDQHVFARLLGADRGIGNQQRRIRWRAGHADAAEHAGREDAVGIGEHGAAADGARGAVDDVVDEIDLAGVHEIVLVDQLERDRRRRRRLPIGAACLAKR